MLVAAAVCPHPPLLVPELAAGAANELDELRSACDAAVASLLRAEPDLVVVVGDAPAVGPFPEGAWGSLASYGVDFPPPPSPHQPRSSSRGSDPPAPTLPLALTIGRWLLDRQESPPQPLCFGISADSSAERCRALGATLADRATRVAMLVMGDGSARRSLKGPGYLDDRAQPYDESVSRSLAAADTQALLELDVELSADLLVAGRASWQLLAGAAEDGRWTGQLTFDRAPYDVTYLVATWSPAPTG